MRSRYLNFLFYSSDAVESNGLEPESKSNEFDQTEQNVRKMRYSQFEHATRNNNNSIERYRN